MKQPPSADAAELAAQFEQPISRAGTHAVKHDLRTVKFGRADVLPMWVADMDLPSPTFLAEALVARAAHPVYGYTMSHAGTRQAVVGWQARRHGWRIQPEHVLLLPGVVPGLAMAVERFSAPGDGVVVLGPVYDPFFGVVQRAGRREVRHSLRWTGARYEIDFARLEAEITAQKPRMLLLCNPHNPGGTVYREAELRTLGELAGRHDLTLVSDEIHADLVFDSPASAPPRRHIPLASLSPELARRTVTLSSAGKTFNVAGLGAGYAIVADPERRAALQAALDQRYFYDPNLFGLLALETCYTHGDAWLGALRAHLQGNIAEAVAFISRELPRARVAAPEATYLLWLDLRAWGLTSAALSAQLVERGGLGLTPGSLFGPEAEGFMRMNLAAPRATVREGLRRLAQGLGHA